MPVTVKDVYDVLNELAPFDTQEAWDNSGLLAGKPDKGVTRVLLALDPTIGAIKQAVELGAELIITHHPILFHARKNIREDDPEGTLLCELARSERALISAHTNLDIAPCGVNAALADCIGLKDVESIGGGMRIGIWEGELSRFAREVGLRLNSVVRSYAASNASVSRVAVCGGAGGSMWKTAYDAGADCFVTGELHHNDALDLTAWGMTALEAGHYETEKPSVKALKIALQKRFDELQYKIMVFDSDYEPF